MTFQKGDTSKVHIYTLALFFLSYIFGFIYGFSIGTEGLSTEGLVNEKIREIDSLYNKNNFDRAIYILHNNSIVCLKIFFLGVFSLGLISLVLIFFNAYVLGLFFGTLSQTYPLRELVAAVLPHSPEIIGIVLSGYISLSISTFIILNKRLIGLKTTAYLSALIIFFIIISAFIESYVSMQ